jgi:Glu-tRNA(Gln) amidotransferase subunit E-like FAD-binding protein
MPEIDYAKVGLKAGIEIHQQLDTGKLFSRTPSYLRKDEPDYTVRRKLHAVAGETGEVDAAVAHEAGLDKEFTYEGYGDTISLVELDEEPPQLLDEEALDVALQMCLLLNCRIYPVSQVMRKTVIDGSNTGGFQRTVLLGHSGFVETSFGKVGIESVVLEEDSARVISREKEKVVYRLDRLGIPLVEVATAPVLQTPEQIKETALKLGEVLRACKVKRGLGTIRQDVNVSITGHDRVEVKGFQDPAMMVKTVDLEIGRQQEDDTPEGSVRNALPDGSTEFLRPMPGRARMYPETDLQLLKIGRERLDRLRKNLPLLRQEMRSVLEKKGLHEELIGLVLDGGVYEEFLTLVKFVPKKADLVGKMVTLWRRDLGKKSDKGFEEVMNVLHEEVLLRILEAVNEERLSEGEVRTVMAEVLAGKDVVDALDRGEQAGDDEVEEAISKIVKGRPGLRPNAYMGLVMKEFGGKLDAKKAMELISKIA